MKQGTHTRLPVDLITLDKDNPRIAKWLEMYEGKDIGPEQIQMALGSPGDDNETQGGTKYETLKNSIRTNGGIIQPIMVNKLPDGRHLCVEGNTRVCLYRWFGTNKVKGDWANIPAIVYDNLDPEAIEAIRLQAHLVGPRQWDPYSKAKYLSYLRNNEMLEFERLVSYCGGSTRTVTESINAYADMETFYRPVCQKDGAEFEARKFSGFVELQKPSVKAAITKAGLNLTDFSGWLHNDKFDRLEHIRQLPAILHDPKARQIFETKGSKAALAILERPELDKALKGAPIAQLAAALAEALPITPFPDVLAMKDDPSSPTMRALQDAKEALDNFLTSFERLDVG